MTLSKKLLSLLSASLLIVGCVKADRKAPQSEKDLNSFSYENSLITFNNRALFEVGDIQIEDIKFSDENEGDWLVADQAQLFMKLCGIRDRATQGTIRNEKFHIKSELGSDIAWAEDGKIADEKNKDSHISNPITVNSGNCLRWTQVIPVFDILAPSVNLALHFEIDSLSGNLGKIVKRVGFNPWDMHRNTSKTRGFMDLTDFNRSQWHTGEWVSGPNVIKALKGELYDGKAELRFANMKIEPVEREKQRVAKYNERLEGLTKEERKIRREIDQKLIEANNGGAGVHINLNFTGKPRIWVPDSTGVPHWTDINTGKFLVYMNLVASGAADNAEKHLISSNVAQITRNNTTFEWSLNRDRLLAASVPLLLKKRTELGRVELLVKIVPRSAGLRKLKPYSAVFDLGEYNNWVRGQSLTYKFDENYESLDQVDYDKYIENVVGIENIDRQIMTIRDMKRFYFSPLRMRFVRIMPGESATDRTLQYSVTTCIENWRGSRVGRGLQFNVVTRDQGKKRLMRRQTNEDGCLSWFGLLSHKYYRREVLEARTADVTYVGTMNNGNNTTGQPTDSDPTGVRNNINQSGEVLNGYSEKFTYYMNPWDEKWTFGWDGPDMPANYFDEIKEQRLKAPKSQLFIADFRYETMGFRYAIDKYLNLKVKKAILLKAYPYVLKYNSIVRGRLGTEKLRDGVYLMKVALQKDYLDPAAKGVRIYDEKLEEPYQIASAGVEGKENFVEMAQEDIDPENLPRAYDLYDNFLPNSEQVLGDGHGVNARMSWNPEDSDERGRRVTHRLLTQSELKESRKEYISVQTKLVRVLGGMIITPVEFEVNDLRLMRIRNQFFIQLQTVDEHKLRVATAIDQAIKEMFDGGSDINARYNEIFTSMEELESLASDHQKIKDILDQYQDENDRLEAEAELVQIEGSIDEARRKIYDVLGLNQFEAGSEEFERRRLAIEERLQTLDTYRRLKNERGLPYLTHFRNDKRVAINNILRRMKDENSVEIESVESEQSGEAQAEADSDPLLKFLFLGSRYDGLGGRVSDLVENDLGVDFETLKYADFTESPLTPSFDFNLLTNDGVHDPEKSPDDGKSGLPSRTFVGPLTFVFNTNGSSLRPTNILNENYCRTAFCEEPERIKLEQFDPSTTRGKIEWGIPPENVEVANKVSENFQLEGASNQAIYASGDSVNANYENNKYYGYLKAYHNVTVDDLIEKKELIDKKEFRKMEEGSQIINYVKTMGLQYSLLEDNPKSRLKSINHECAQSIEVSRIRECFNDITDGKDVLKANTLLGRLADRSGENPHALQKEQKGFDNFAYYNVAGKEPLTVKDLNEIMTHGWKSEKVDAAVARKFMHRMCFALAQDFFKEKYFEKNIVLTERLSAWNKKTMNSRSLIYVERLCHRFIGNVYNYFRPKTTTYEERWGNLDGRHRDMSIRPNPVAYSPIVVERKVRAYDTTDRYVYRGGKSLNINLSANFSLSSNTGLRAQTSASFKPWEWVLGGVGAIAGGVAGFFAAGPPGAVAGGVKGASIGATLIGAAAVGTATKQLTTAFSISRTNSKDESAGRAEATSVTAGTFLVTQQATFDIELGDYERCMVVRFHPLFIKAFHEQAVENGWVKKSFQVDDTDSEESDINKTGVFICSGNLEPKENLHLREKYYYFTQHFTEGDMLDTADLHNHPWLLQLRGYRDFQVFTSMIGAREVDHIDTPYWLNHVVSRTASDAAAFKLNGSNVDNLKPIFKVADQSSDMNWPLEELGRTYFEVLPTFPGLYTYMNETGENVSDWPYENTDPGRSLRQEPAE